MYYRPTDIITDIIFIQTLLQNTDQLDVFYVTLSEGVHSSYRQFIYINYAKSSADKAALSPRFHRTEQHLFGDISSILYSHKLGMK